MKRNEKELFTEKARTYVVCYSNECPMRNHCLRRRAGAFVATDRLTKDCVNLLNPQTGTTSCPMFSNDQPVIMKRGMRAFFDEMPQKTAYAIRKMLLDHYGTNAYYKMRCGQMPITPARQQFIEKVCRKAGWLLPPTFDQSSTEYDWEARPA